VRDDGRRRCTPASFLLHHAVSTGPPREEGAYRWDEARSAWNRPAVSLREREREREEMREGENALPRGRLSRARYIYIPLRSPRSLSADANGLVNPSRHRRRVTIGRSHAARSSNETRLRAIRHARRVSASRTRGARLLASLSRDTIRPRGSTSPRPEWLSLIRSNEVVPREIRSEAEAPDSADRESSFLEEKGRWRTIEKNLYAVLVNIFCPR